MHLFTTGSVFALLSILSGVAQSETIDYNIPVPLSKFASLDNAKNLEKFLRKQGYNQPLPYKKFAKDIHSVINEQTAFIAVAETPLIDSPVQTFTNSDAVKEGPSYTNATSQSDKSFVKAYSFSGGNSASSGGSIQRMTTIPTHSSSGKGNAINHVTAEQSQAHIDVTAKANGASTHEVVNGGEQDAVSASVCAAGADGATAHGMYNRTYTFPVNNGGKPSYEGRSLTFCEAGVNAMRHSTPASDSTKTSVSAAIAGPNYFMTTVTCDGTKIFGGHYVTTYRLRMKGSSTSSKSFVGKFVVEKMVSNHAHCHVSKS